MDAPRRSFTLEYRSVSSARARPDWSSVSWAKRERESSVDKRACERRRAATTSEEASVRMASGSEDGFSGPRRRMMVPLVLMLVTSEVVSLLLPWVDED